MTFKRLLRNLALLVCTSIAQGCFCLLLTQQPGPNYRDTVAFMNRSVEPEKGSVLSANSCELEILRNRLYTSAFPTETFVKHVDSAGIKHYGFKWSGITEPYHVARFDLTQIDPTSIASEAVASPEFVVKHDIDEHPSELDHPDLYSVTYKSRDSVATIMECENGRRTEKDRRR